MSCCVFDSPTPRVLSFYTRPWLESALHGMLVTIRKSAAVPRGALLHLLHMNILSPLPPCRAECSRPPSEYCSLHTHLVPVGMSCCVFDSPTPRVLSFYTRPWLESALHGMLVTIRKSAAI